MGRPRKYELNEKYFDDINSDNKAYILGFIYADGGIYKNHLTISLASKDHMVLDFIKQELGYSGVIYEYFIKGNKYVRLSISSKKICNDLITLGILENKTYTSKKLQDSNSYQLTSRII